MKKILRKVKNKLKKASNEAKAFKPEHYSKARYFWYRDHYRLNKKAILAESAQGGCPSDNIAVMLKELVKNDAYRDYTIWLSGGKGTEAARKQYLKQNNLQHRVKILTIGTLQYYKKLATAKFLLTEDAFIHYFTKRQGQVLLNTWHGTPLMTLGKYKKMDYAFVGNEQKSFFDSDFLLCPNEFTKQCLLKDYMLENFGQAKLLMGGYPRNVLLRDEESRKKVRAAYGLEELQVIAYMPTWRKITRETSKKIRTAQMKEHLKTLDELLSDTQVVYVKQHTINRVNLDFSDFRHIRPFPTDCPTYEFLNVTDVLVTDYSSVMFDYLTTGRKIILFVPDSELFDKIRGLHMELSELPFPKVETVEQLAGEINTPKQYDDRAAVEEYCAYESDKIAEQLCRRWILGETVESLPEAEIPYNGKKNVLIYMGGFEKNGLTTAGVNLLNTLDRTKHNYAVIYCVTSLKERQENILVLPEDVARIGFYHFRALTFAEQIPYMIWRGFRKTPYAFVKKVMKRLSVRGMERLMGGCRVDTAIQFTGYNDEMIGIMQQMPCKRIIYVHNDMEQEIKTRANANRGLLSHAYKAYDYVAVVTEDILPPAKRIAESDKEKGAKEAQIVWCKNVIDYKRIRTMGNESLAFDDTTVVYPSKKAWEEIRTSNKKKFITVGRYSPEKGHDRLIRACERIHAEHPDTCLVVIGGHGVLWNQTMRQVKNCSCPDAIILIKFMSNPHPLVKECDYFVLPSLYEGFGLVLVEADILGIPCFSTDITGPRRFMKKYGGVLVEDSEDGIVSGMRSCLAGEIPQSLSIDYEQYNREAISQFESII